MAGLPVPDAAGHKVKLGSHKVQRKDGHYAEVYIAGTVGIMCLGGYEEEGTDSHESVIICG